MLFQDFPGNGSRPDASMLTVDRWVDRGARRASMPPRASAPAGSWHSERDLQRHLRLLQDRGAAIERDLVDLQRSLTYQLLVDGGQVSGVTQARLEPTLSAVDHLWLGFSVLGDLLGEAGSIVANGVLADLDQLRDVEWLLFEDSVELEGRRLSPDQFLSELVQALSATAQIVEEADDVWRHTIPALARSEEEIEALQRRASDAGAPQAEDLHQLRIQASWLRGQASRDPLGVAEAFQDDLLPRLDQVRHRLGQEQRQQQIVDADLDRAQQRLAELEELHARVVEEAGSVWAKIAHPRGLVTPPDGGYLADPPMGLGPWLARLRALSQAGTHRPASRGLASWMEAADAAVARELEVLEINQGPLRQRQELRGLLSSLQAKAEALGLARDPALADIGRRAKAILYATQTDLDEAALLVRGYGERLRVVNSEEVSDR